MSRWCASILAQANQRLLRRSGICAARVPGPSSRSGRCQRTVSTHRFTLTDRETCADTIRVGCPREGGGEETGFRMHSRAFQETGSRACGLLLACALTFSGVALAPAVEGDLHPIAVVPASSSIAFRGPTGVVFLPDRDAATFEQTVFVADPLSKSVTGVEADGTIRGPWYGVGGELFVEPTDVACDLSGHVFVADKGRPYVYKLDAATGALVEKIGSGLMDAVGIDWLEDTGGAHKLFVADEGHARVVRFGDAADTSEGAWYTAGAQLYRPADVEAPFGSGVIWVTDADRDMVFCIDLLNDMPIYSWGASGTGVGQLSAPVGIAIRSDYGNDVVVSDAGGRVQRFTQGGVHVSTIVGPGLARGAVSSPQRIALDGANNWFWVAERDSGRVQLINSLGGVPAQPSIRGGGRGTAWGEFDKPGALAVAGPWLLVCDTGNNRVQAIDINHDTPMHAFGSEGSGETLRGSRADARRVRPFAASARSRRDPM